MKKSRQFFSCTFLSLLTLSANATTYTVTNNSDAGAGSLRQAITDANGTPATDIIEFNISGSGPHTITLATDLPIISSPVSINGYTQSGASQGTIGSRNIMIMINGGSITGRDGLFRFTPAASNSSISGLSVYNAGYSTEVIVIEPGSSDVHIWGNYIGVLADGTSPASSADYNGDDAVLIGLSGVNSGSFTNIIIGTNGDGTNDANEGNVLSNSNDASYGGDGIQIGTPTATYTWSNIKISGNYIGLAADGITAAPNGYNTSGIASSSLGQDGINIFRASNILIGSDANGTSDVYERNIISGNKGNGIDIALGSNNISIAGNYIGTNKSGTTAIPNGTIGTSLNPYCGILINGTSGTGGAISSIIIGFNDATHSTANAAAARNVISGNHQHGIQFLNVSGSLNKISGNYIGVNATGNTALGNGQANSSHPAVIFNSHSIDINSTSNLLVGTDADGNNDVLEHNVISGNIDARGIFVRNTSSNNVIAGNYIGIGADGATAIGNDFSGVHIDVSNNNRIGSNDDGTNDAIEANIIANNAKSTNASNPSNDGIRITGNATQNRISRNIFYANKATPIDLANNGVSVNDGSTTAANPNILIDYPVFTAYSISGTTMTVSGYIGNCSGTETIAGTTVGGTVTVQVYKLADDGDQTAAISGACGRNVVHGEGVQYLGSVTAVSGVFTASSFTLVAGASFNPGDKLTGITIDANGNTSEFGVDVAPVGYIYVHKKALNEVNKDFSFSITGGTTTVPNFTLNDDPAQTPVLDIGASESGRLWASNNANVLYYRDVNSTVWVNTGITGVEKVDGGPGNTCYYINTVGTVFSYAGAGAPVQISAVGQFANSGGWNSIGSGWTGTPTAASPAGPALYAVMNNENIYKYSGSGTTWNIYANIAGSNQYRIDVNPTNGNVYVGGSKGSVISISEITPALVVNNLGLNQGYRDIAVNQNGEIYATSYSWTYPAGWFVNKYSSGTTWTIEPGSFDGSSIAGGVGNSLWLIINSGGWSGGSGWTPASGPYPFYNIFSRGFDGTDVTYIDDERVRTSTGNSQLIPVAPGTYTITEAITAGWDLQKILLYDPSANSSSNQVAGTATINVTADEVVHVVFQNGELNPIAMTNSCSVAYLETFGVGTSVGTATTVGSYGVPMAGQTSYHYLTGSAPGEDGYYKIVNRANPDFNTWSSASGITDHTPGDGTLGNMYAVNAGYDKGDFFRRRFNGVIPGATYSFSAWIIDLTPSNTVNVSFLVLDHTTQTVLGSYSTGALPTITPNVWRQYGFSFTATAADIDLVISNNGIGGNGNDLAIDDISFVMSPVDTPVTTVASTGCGTLGSITVTSPVGASYEYSKDGFVSSIQSGPVFSSLTPGIYTISARYVGTTGCITSKIDTIGATICGNIWDDANGDGANSSENPIVSGVWVNLVDPITHVVLQSVQVNASGQYFFTGLPQSTNYQIILSNTDMTGSLSLTSASLPAGYRGTGSNRSSVADTTNKTSIISVNTGTSGLTQQNLGIEKEPLATSKVFTIVKTDFSGTPPSGYPVVTDYVSILSSSPTLVGYDGTGGKLSGTDAEDCALPNACNTGSTFTIGTINSNTLLYYDFGSGPVALDSGNVITGFDSSKLVIYGHVGTGTAGSPVGFEYTMTDAAGVVSPIATYSIVSSTSLPIGLLSFTATKSDNTKALLQWSTGIETYIESIAIEHSINGSVWRMIGSQQSKGSKSNYFLLHNNPSNGNNFYRLKFAETDGKMSYSPIRTLNFSDLAGSTMTLYPNPAHETLQINYNGESLKGAYIQLVNSIGQVVIQKHIDEPITGISLAIDHLAKGLYIVQVICEGKNYTQNLILE